MPKVQLPPGGRSLSFERPNSDGVTRYTAAREGGFVNVSEDHARAIDRIGGNGTAGLLSGNPGVFVTSGRKNGRWCKTCLPARLWHPWTTECPRCGSPTDPE